MQGTPARRYRVIATEQLTFGVEELDETGLLRTITGFLTERDATGWIEAREEPGIGIHRARLKAELDQIDNEDRAAAAPRPTSFPSRFILRGARALGLIGRT
jgi:hypothetical protein